MIAPLLGAVWLFWGASNRVHRIRHVTAVVSGDAALSPASPTGYTDGMRDLVVTSPGTDSFHWIAQTQQMLARNEWRVRHIEYENAPEGLDLRTPSPYRWWLGAIAWVDHYVSGRTTAVAVERAALFSDPVLQFLLLAAVAGLWMWRRGGWAALPATIGVIGLFPLAAGFTPGVPDGKSLSLFCSVASVLLLQAGFHPASASSKPDRWFFAAGVAGGCGLWVGAAEQVPVILSLVLGALFSLWLVSRKSPEGPPSSAWLAWAVGGASTSLLAYLVEYYPSGLATWDLQQNHPLYALAWLGLGTALAALTTAAREHRAPNSLRAWAGILFGVAGLAVVAGMMIRQKDAGFLAVDTWTFRLIHAPDGPEAASLWAWLIHDGITPTVLAVLLPLLITIPAAWLLIRHTTAASHRAALALGLGTVVPLAALACWQLGRWSSVDAALLALLPVLFAALREIFPGRATPWVLSASMVLLLAPGAWQARPRPTSGEVVLNEAEVSGLIMRDLGHWLARRTAVNHPVVLAPPDVTAALHYYGSLRGIGTFSWGNQNGFSAAARMFAATTPQEALARLQSRGVTHIVLPSWDTYVNEYLKLSAVQPENAFVSGLRNWAPIPWLRPIAYALPAVPGYEGQYVAVFEIVPEQDEATIIGWQAEYFADMGQLDFAASTAQALQRFPNDLPALITRGQVALARRDAAGLDAVLKLLAPRLAAGADRNLSWPRRVNLAALLAQGGKADSAREQARRCLADATGPRLRGASTATVYRLLALAKAFSLEFADPSLRALARDLVPPDSRAAL